MTDWIQPTPRKTREQELKKARSFGSRIKEPESKDATVQSLLTRLQKVDVELTAMKAKMEYWERRAHRAEIDRGRVLSEMRGLNGNKRTND